MSILVIDARNEKELVIRAAKQGESGVIWKRKRQETAASEHIVRDVDHILRAIQERPTAILVCTNRATFTVTRCSSVVGNALAYAWGIPVRNLHGHTTNEEVMRVVVEMLANTPKDHRSSFTVPVYTGPARITQSKKKSSKRPVHEHSAGTMVFWKGKILCVYDEWNKEWAFPKGGINDGETPEQAAVRETKEETGYSVRVGKRIGVSRYQFTHPKTGEFTRKKVEYFLATPLSSERAELSASDRGRYSVKWVKVDAAPDVLTLPSLRNLVQRVIQNRIHENFT